MEEWIRKVEDLEQAVKVVPYKFNTTFSTKLGGLPNFIQGEDEAPGESYRGDAGMGYIYLKLEGDETLGHFFWQCS